jgi:streptogramin lyase
VIAEFSIPTTASHPTRIAAGPDGDLWFIETFANKIGRITTSGAITEFSVSPISPAASVELMDITAGPDSNVWFSNTASSSQSAGGALGRITPSGFIDQFAITGVTSMPSFVGVSGLIAGHDEVWGRVVRIGVEWKDDGRSRVNPLVRMRKVIREAFTIRCNLRRGLYRV